MAITKTIIANGSKGHHRFSLKVNEDTTSENSSFMSYSFTIAPIQTGWDWADWGTKISYVIKIGDNTYNGTITAYNGSSTITLSSSSNIEIPHNSDGTKTINISFSVTDTTGVNYTCGNASSSSTLTLSVLHKAPEITTVSVIESNTQLTGLGVDNNTIVQYLSNKKFTVTATYDDATINECSIYHNNVLIGTSTTNEVIVDFGSVAELITSGTDSVGLNIAIKDSKEGYSTRMFNFPVIKYTRPTIEGTSTTIVRKTGNGTVLTDNIAVLNFVGTCYKGNDVIGNANKPTIQYKIWSGTEPDYTTITTPNVENVIIKDYEINDVLYTSVYDYKINMYDVFTKTETTTNLKVGRVPTGKSVWSEYKDRVDYLALTRQGKQIYANIYSFDEVVIGTYNDKLLYRKIIDFGALNSQQGVKTVQHNIIDLEQIIDIKIIGYDGDLAFPIPFVGTEYMFASAEYTTRVDKENIYIYVSDDKSTQTAKVTIEYTKTTD